MPAGILFSLIAFGAAAMLVVFVILGSLGVVSPVPNLPETVMRVVGLVILVSGFTVIGMLSGSIPPRQSSQTDWDWWQANSRKAVITWAGAEGLAVIGGVLFLITGDLVLLLGLGGGGLVILMLNRPKRMMEG